MRGSAPRLLAVNVVHKMLRGPSRDTAIDKRPVAGMVAVGELGLAGDKQGDTRNHGGTDQALYAYASEDAAYWTAQLNREITPGLFGENLTTQRLDITAALIGERWRIGARGTGIVVEVRMPRTPCVNLSARMGIPPPSGAQVHT
ncbi:MAG: MOSC domain-containing protein [Micromonosporaceae bacterium]